MQILFKIWGKTKLMFYIFCHQECRQKNNFQGGGATKKKTKNSKKDRKIALLSLYQGGGQRNKDRKIAKKG